MYWPEWEKQFNMHIASSMPVAVEVIDYSHTYDLTFSSDLYFNTILQVRKSRFSTQKKKKKTS